MPSRMAAVVVACALGAGSFPACATSPAPRPAPPVVHTPPPAGLDQGDLAARSLASEAIAALLAGREQDALKLAERSHKIRPFGLPAGLVLIESLLALGRRSDARVFAERLRDAHPARVEAHTAFGKSLFALGRFTEARAVYDQALAVAPDDHDAGLGLLACMALAPAFDAATVRGLAERLLAARPADADVLHQLAIAAETRNDLAAARALYVEALAARPHHPFAHYNLARLVHAQDGLGAARAHYLSFLEQAPKSAVSEKESVEKLLEKEAP